MIKLLGSVLVAGGGLWLGCFAAGWLRLRLRTLEDVIRGLALLEGEMALRGGALEELMQDVGIPIVGSSFYTSGSEHVARSAEDTIRLSHQGVLEYQSGGEGSFLVVSQQRQDDLFQCVESCRELVNKLAGKRCGDAGV